MGDEKFRTASSADTERTTDTGLSPKKDGANGATRRTYRNPRVHIVPNFLITLTFFWAATFFGDMFGNEDRHLLFAMCATPLAIIIFYFLSTFFTMGFPFFYEKHLNQVQAFVMGVVPGTVLGWAVGSDRLIGAGLEHMVSLSLEFTLVSLGLFFIVFIFVMVKEDKRVEKALHPCSFDRLVEALNTNDDRMVETAVKKLGELGDQRAVEPLVGLLDEEDMEIRDAAIMALAELKATEAVPELLERLKSEKCPSCDKIQIALCRIGDERATEVMFEGLSASYQVKEAAIKALAGQAFRSTKHISDVVERLLAMLQDENWQTRRGAVEALGRIGDRKTLEPLQALAQREQKWIVRRVVIKALKEIEIHDRIPILPVRSKV